MAEFESVRSPRRQARIGGIEVEITAAGLLVVGVLLLAHAVLASQREVWGGVFFGLVLVATGTGLMQRHVWARRCALWLFLVGLLSGWGGYWDLADLVQGVNALRGVSASPDAVKQTVHSLSTDQALLIGLAYWGVGWCAWQLLSRISDRDLEAQADLRRLRKRMRDQRRSPST